MILSILLLVILILINGIFSSSELAFLSSIQIGITLAGFLASAFAADYFADYFIKKGFLLK